MTIPCTMKVRVIKIILCILLLCATLSIPTPVPVGTFRSECHERHFWLFVRSGSLGPMSRFDVQDHQGVHFLSGRKATECGYTMLLNHHGDLVFRASFLACHVNNQGDSEFRLKVWLVTRQVNGRDLGYPFLLHCSAQWPWGFRELVCEENYMEVSIKGPVPAALHSWQKKKEVGKRGMMFHRPGHTKEEVRPRTMTEASDLGYHISESGSRIILRCPYSSPLSYTIKEKGVELEVVNATILYPHQGKVLAIDATVACSMNEATVDGAHLLWPVPHVLSPLVHGRFRDRGMRIGVETLALSESVIKDRGYEIGLRDGVVEVSVPFGAEGTHVKSGVLEGQYSQSLSVDLFYMHQWEDDRWPLTQHRSFRFLKTAYVPRTPTLTDNTISSQKVFSVSLGVFPPDVSLHNVTGGSEGDTLSWVQVPYPNGSHSYQLHAPFSHPSVLQKYVDGGYRRYTLPLTFSLTISPHGEVFYHNATIVSDVQEQTAPEPPRLEGKCTERGLLMLLHYGAQERSWELFLGDRRLDWELVEMGGFTVETEEDYFSVEIPLYSPGMTYEEVSLQGVVGRLEVSVVDIDTLKVENSLIHRCTFRVRELLVCLPEGRMVVVTDTSRTIPPTQPKRTTLLDPSCVPQETDSVRALFNFSLDSCGTIATVEGNFLVYANQVLYPKELITTDDPPIHRDSPYRLTILCRYPAINTGIVSIEHPVNPTFALSPMLPLKHTRREASRSGQYVAVVCVAIVVMGALIAATMKMLCCPIKM
ncbi:uncharacterized protein LOC129835438 [Salvelinus fontinalis]|uniref:uncharacterized protein LOC129835438 n=1 Tax=Salvelinus fontinalis TaxID=8038 RepID=UPI002485E35B|nr:uncharacterized protein LOC129835438 [Salvelinus fontinalis]